MSASFTALSEDQVGHGINTSLRRVRSAVAAGLWILFIFGSSSAARSFGLHLQNIERYFWMPVDLLVVFWIATNRRQAFSMMANNKILMSWAALACLSALWSMTPWISLYEGLELLLTILVGFYLAVSWPGVRILQFLFSALLLTQILSVMLVFLKPAWAIDAAGPWQGAFTHKNELGSMMTLQILTSLMLFLSGWRRILTSSAMLAALALLLLSRSGTALLALSLVLSVIPFAMSYRQSSSVSSLFAGLSLIFIVSLAALLGISGYNPVDHILGGLGKDQTLTGRTVLWDFAIDAFSNKPWLGYGYKGYWESDLTTVHNLHYVIGSKLWFFHNVFLEVAVAFGPIGPVLLILGMAIGFMRSLQSFGRSRTYISLWPFLFVLYLLFDLFVENPLFENHGLLQLLFVVALCARFDTYTRLVVQPPPQFK